MKLVSRWLGGALMVAAPFLVLGGCPGGEDGGGGTGGAGGLGGDAAGDVADGDGAEPWDPVWHETTPKDWPTVGPEKNPDCGPGCRVALNVPLANDVRAYTTARELHTSAPGLAFAGIGAAETSILPHPPDTWHIQVGLWGDYVSSAHSFGPGQGRIALTSLVTGESKVVFSWTPADGADGSELTALNDKYVFYTFKGIHSRNRQTGEQKWLAFGSCYSACATEGLLVCENGKIYVLDPELPELKAKKKLDDGKELQVDGSCSADRKQYVWIDYRDPPGPGSNFDFTRKGGEVYFHDFSTGKTRRATFDSPDKPRAKVYPGIGDGLAVWNEAPLSAAEPSPEDWGSYYGVSEALATLDLATGKRCQLENGPALGYKSVHGRNVYAVWLDKKANQARLVDIDLDYAGFKWQCQDTPGWVK